MLNNFNFNVVNFPLRFYHMDLSNLKILVLLMYKNCTLMYVWIQCVLMLDYSYYIDIYVQREALDESCYVNVKY